MKLRAKILLTLLPLVIAPLALLAALESTLPAFAPRVMLLGLASIAVFIVLGSMVLRALVTRPVKALKQAAEQLSQGSQPVAIDVRSKDELGELAELTFQLHKF